MLGNQKYAFGPSVARLAGALGALTLGSLLLFARPDMLLAFLAGVLLTFLVIRYRAQPEPEHIAAARHSKTENEVLFQALAEARQASEDKSLFLAKASHEIRNPMNAVLGMTELLLTTRLTPEQREYAGAVRDSAASLLSLVNDLLDLSRIGAGTARPQETRFDPSDLVRSVVLLMHPKARRRGITLDAAIAADLPSPVIGDPGRIRQVLVNLVSNAVRFTRTGGVTIRLDQGEGEMLRFTVRDTGCGIPASDLSRIFEPFAVADVGSDGEGNTGLGLSICRQLVESMGGRIEVTSRVGAGSEFSFAIRCQKPTLVTPLLAPAGDTRILVAEDNAVNQRLTLRLLERQGYRVDLVSNGMEAIKAVLRGPYNLILMDIQMPEMDGLQATDAIRQLETGRHTPIVALTASGLYEDVRRCLDAGMDDYLNKPFTADALQGKLDRWLARHPMAAAISA